MLPISRSEAKLSGTKRYYTGKPCINGHTDERRVHDGACCECQRISYRQYQSDNTDRERARKRADMRLRRDSIPDGLREEIAREHYQTHRAGYIARARMRQVSCRDATPPWVNKRELLEIYKACPDGHHVDHIIPLKGIMPDGSEVRGLHVPWNLQYLTAEDNLKKSNKVQRCDLNEDA